MMADENDSNPALSCKDSPLTRFHCPLPQRLLFIRILAFCFALLNSWNFHKGLFKLSISRNNQSRAHKTMFENSLIPVCFALYQKEGKPCLQYLRKDKIH